MPRPHIPRTKLCPRCKKYSMRDGIKYCELCTTQVRKEMIESGYLEDLRTPSDKLSARRGCESSTYRIN